MSNLYGPDEGYETSISRTNTKKSKNNEKKLRKQMEELMEDQEPVMNGPPFNPVNDLSKLSYGRKSTKCIITNNAESHWRVGGDKRVIRIGDKPNAE